MKVIGLTGSIGMGKTTTALMFEALGVLVQDADAVVHALYNDPQFSASLSELFPDILTSGRVDRKKLAQHVVGNDEAMLKLENFVHPHVKDRRATFIEQARLEGAPYVILDVPLLYETGINEECDAVICVTASAEIQRDRVLARDGMTVSKFEAILARQMPDSEKRARSQYCVDTSNGLAAAREQVAHIHADLLGTPSQTGDTHA